MMTENSPIVSLPRSSGENVAENYEGRRNKKARVLNSLLSATALGIFLEGCSADFVEGINFPVTTQDEGNVLLDLFRFFEVENNLPASSTDGNTPETPAIPAIPETPPETPVIPETPETPETPPETPVIPETPETPPETPVIPETPETPETPPETPVIPETPETPETPPETPVGYVDPDDYLVESEETVAINFDIDGGRLLFRDVTNDELVTFNLYQGNDADVVIGTARVFIKSSPALQNGLYSLNVGENNDFSGYLYIGTSSPDELTADARGTGRLVGFSGDDVLIGNYASDGLSGGAGHDEIYGAGGDDTLYGGSDNDLLQGGIGNDDLLGEGGSDTYIFDAGDGNDIIRGSSDELGNKLIFDPLSGGPYADTDFQFYRGFLSGGERLSEASSGSDLEIVVSQEGVERNRVIIQDYFASGDDDAYTIYRNSELDSMIVSTAPTETA